MLALHMLQCCKFSIYVLSIGDQKRDVGDASIRTEMRAVFSRRFSSVGMDDFPI
jgi:hypothetical protein